MSLIPDSSDKPRARVLPKVFADVPTAAELSSARSSRSWLTLVVVLLIGMLAASVVGVVYFEGQARELPETISDLELQTQKLKQTITERDKTIEELQQANDEAVGEYAVISRRLDKNNQLRAAIAGVLKDKPGAKNAVRPALGSADSHTAYDTPAWVGLRHQVEEQLQKETEELQGIEAAVKKWAPPRNANPGVDPRN